MKKITVLFFTGLFSLVGLFAGAKFTFSGIAEVVTPDVVDNRYRFFAGVFFTVGCGFAYCLSNIKNCATLYRLLMGTLFIGGISRAVGAFTYATIETPVVVAIVIELTIPPLLIWMQSGLEREHGLQENLQTQPA